jgi:enediyne biosynthesis protein E8
MEPASEHGSLLEDLTRRGFLQRAGLGALVLAAGPLARELVAADPARAQLAGLPVDATLQAFADTMIPGRKASKTDLGNAIDPRAIAGVDNRPGAVEADALALFHHPLIGFDALEGPFLTDLNARALQHGGEFVGMGFDDRVKVCVDGLAFSNPSRILWEASAAVPFTAFCAAGVIPEQTAAKASGYRVMGLPGKAPRGYRGFSYRKKLSKERTKKGSLG